MYHMQNSMKQHRPVLIRGMKVNYLNVYIYADVNIIFDAETNYVFLHLELVHSGFEYSD